MSDVRFFAGDKQLGRVWLENGSGNRPDNFMGFPEGVEASFIPGKGWIGGAVKAERMIRYKSNPSRHECDDRCMNATGRTMNCECSCGGKNHGRGAFVCEAA
jgi:hypothetical protein